MKEYFPMSRISNSIVPRSARRVRKPLQDDWIKGPGPGVWLKCTYAKCSFQWQYFSGHKWAECPICHSIIKVAAAKRNFIDNHDEILGIPYKSRYSNSKNK
jgi:hypothetical protein